MILGTLGAGYFGYHYGVWAGVARRGRLRRCSAACCTRSPRSSSASTTSSPVSRSTSSPPASPRSSPRSSSPTCPGAARPSRRRCDTPPTITIPGLSDPAHDLEDKHWFLVSDLAGVVGRWSPRISVLTLIALGLIFGTGWLLWKTSLRPAAARRAASRPRRPRRSASTSTATSSSRCWPRARSPASAVRYLAMVSVVAATRTDRPTAWLHRPGRDDLRQLAPGRAAPRRPLLFGYTAGRPAPRRVASRCTRCC